MLARGFDFLLFRQRLVFEMPRAPPAMAPAAPTDVATVKDGAFAEQDGSLVVRVGERFAPANLSEWVARRVRGPSVSTFAAAGPRRQARDPPTIGQNANGSSRSAAAAAIILHVERGLPIGGNRTHAGN